MTKKIRLIIFTVLLLGFVGMSATAFHYYQVASSMSMKPASMTNENVSTDIAATSTAALVARVGKLILLPTGEEPTVATVSDPSKLKDQPFFDNAQTGDKVLIYQNARKAFLYSVSMNKLIEVAPINVGASSTTTQEVSKTSGSTTTPKKK